MQRGRNTLILLVLAVALGAYVYFVESKRTPAAEPGPGGSTPETRVKLFDKLDSTKIDDVKLKGSAGEQTHLKKNGNAWQIVEPVQSAVDDTEVTGLITNLGTVEADRTVDENPKDLSKYGLAQPRVELEFTAGDKNARKLLIGSKTVTGAGLYAKLANENKVLLIPAYLESTFDRTTFQLRDKAILKLDRDKVDSLEIATAGSGTGKTATPGVTLKFAKQGEAWKMTAPVATRTDSTAVDNVIGRIASGQMKALTAPDAPAADLAKYGLDKPAVQVTLGAGSARSSLLIGKPAEAGPAATDLYAKDASRPMVFTLEKAVADDLKKSADDFRTKDVFDARAFTTTHLDVTRGGATTVFEKTQVKEKDAQGKEKEPVDKWTQTQPAAAKPVDAAKIEDAVNKITGLRADSFADKLPAGAAEVATVNTKFDEGKKSEKVVVYKAGADYYATRGDEAGAARLPAGGVDDAIKALDAVK